MYCSRFWRLRTSSCTNAPVSSCSSHGAVVSQARSRTKTSSIRTAWPGCRVRSREMPLRLLRRPSTATRSFIGVVPGASSVTVCGISIVSGSAAACLFPSSRTGAPCGLQAGRRKKPARASLARRCLMPHRASTPGNRRSPRHAAHHGPAIPMAGRRTEFQ